jgi:uncharacterized membrane protein YuzA (DUF378 family)
LPKYLQLFLTLFIVDKNIIGIKANRNIYKSKFLLSIIFNRGERRYSKMAGKSVIDWIAYVLVIIGALNWGLVGLGDWNLVDMIFGSVAWLAKAVYILVGLAGLWIIYALTK